MTRSRREALHALASAAGVGLAGLAGCVGPTDTAPGTGSDATTTRLAATDTTTEGTEEPTPADLIVETGDASPGMPVGPDVEADGSVVTSLVVRARTGDPLGDDHPEGLVVVNDTDAERTATLTIDLSGGSVLDRTVDLPPDGRFEVELRVPATYDATVRSGGATANRTVEPGTFDCNSSATTFALRGDRVEKTTVSTSLACLTPTPER